MAKNVFFVWMAHVVVSDNYTAFSRKEIQTLLKGIACVTYISTPCHSLSNGRAERMVCEIMCALRKQTYGIVAYKFWFFYSSRTPRHTLRSEKCQENSCSAEVYVLPCQDCSPTLTSPAVRCSHPRRNSNVVNRCTCGTSLMV